MLIRLIQMGRLDVKIRGKHLKMFFIEAIYFVIERCGFSTMIVALGSRPYCLVRGLCVGNSSTPRRVKREVHILLLPATCTLQSYANTSQLIAHTRPGVAVNETVSIGNHVTSSSCRQGLIMLCNCLLLS